MGFKLTTLVVIGTDCIGSCKSSTAAPTDFKMHSTTIILKYSLYKIATMVPSTQNSYPHLWCMVSLLASSVVDRGFEPRSGQTKDYKIGICCFSTKHVALRRKSKDWLVRNQNNVSEWRDMSTHRLLFQ